MGGTGQNVFPKSDVVIEVNGAETFIYSPDFSKYTVFSQLWLHETLACNVKWPSMLNVSSKTKLLNKNKLFVRST